MTIKVTCSFDEKLQIEQFKEHCKEHGFVVVLEGICKKLSWAGYCVELEGNWINEKQK